MPRLYTKQSHKAGMAPGSVVYMGAAVSQPVKLRVVTFSADSVNHPECGTIDDALSHLADNTVTWIDVTGLHNAALLQSIGKAFNIHPLALEDITNTDQRPKFEDHDAYLFYATKMLYNKEACATFQAEQVSFVVGKNYVLSFQETADDIFDKVRERIGSSRWRIRKRGADYLAFALIDVIVDHYFHVLEDMGDAIESIESNLSEKTLNKETSYHIHALTQELVLLRKYCLPMRSMLRSVKESESALIQPETKLYYSDVYDHLLQINDMIESFRSILDSLDNRILSLMSHQMNSTMQILTIFASIFMPITFIAGIYGMNFEYMPELAWHWGYFGALGLMLVTIAVMLGIFKAKKIL